MKHEMKLNNGPFERIKNGTKTIELRLNDEKRQLLKIKDLIEFTNRTNNEKMLVEIENLYHYPSFEELYKNFDKVKTNYSLVNSYVVESLTGFETVKGLGIENEINNQFKDKYLDLLEVSLKLEKLINMQNIFKNGGNHA